MDENPPKNGDIQIMDVDLFGVSKPMPCKYNSSRDEWIPIEEITPKTKVCKPSSSKPLSPTARTVLEMKKINKQQHIKLQREKEIIQQKRRQVREQTIKELEEYKKYPEGIGCNLMGGRRRATLQKRSKRIHTKRTKRSRAKRLTKRRRKCK